MLILENVITLHKTYMYVYVCVCMYICLYICMSACVFSIGCDSQLSLSVRLQQHYIRLVMSLRPYFLRRFSNERWFTLMWVATSHRLRPKRKRREKLSNPSRNRPFFLHKATDNHEWTLWNSMSNKSYFLRLLWNTCPQQGKSWLMLWTKIK